VAWVRPRVTATQVAAAAATATATWYNSLRSPHGDRFEISVKTSSDLAAPPVDQISLGNSASGFAHEP